LPGAQPTLCITTFVVAASGAQPGSRRVRRRYVLDSLSGVASDFQQHLPLYHALIKVDPEYPHCCFSFRREWLDDHSPKDKMILPTMAPRVEETDERAGPRIDRTYIASLPCVAAEASVREVVDYRQTAVLATDYMVYLMR
jgi:hypothetical protein